MRIAIAGATGLTGEVLLSLLPHSRLSDAGLLLLASSASAGTTIETASGSHEVQELRDGCFGDVDLAFFAVGDALSAEFVPQALDAGAKVVDKSNAFRLAEGVPLVVAGVNDHAIGAERLVANPNCTTIGFVHAIAPLMDFGIEEVVAASYQSLSGAGREAVRRFWVEAGKALKGEPETYSEDAAAALQVVPAIDQLMGDEHKEEAKLRLETAKILGLSADRIYNTAVRVPILVGHSIAIHLRLSRPVSESEVREAFTNNPTLLLLATGETPTSLHAIQYPNRVIVGRVRVRDEGRCVELFAVSDNLNIGAAFNGLLIAEQMLS